MPTLMLAYIALSVLGCGYVLVSLFLGHGTEGGHGGHDAHGSAHEAHMAYGVKGEGHGAAEAGSFGPAAFHFPFFSPLALAAFFGALGAWGLIAHQGFGASDGHSLLVAVPAACVTTYLVTYLAFKLVAGSTGSSQIRAADLQGALAEVTTPIPAGGMGEVVAMVDGQRFSGPAREAGGREVARGALVRVQALVGSTIVVEKKEG